MITKAGRIHGVEQYLSLEPRWDRLYVCLAQDYDSTPDEDIDHLNITPCDFDGYEEIMNPAWGDVTINGVGRAVTLSDILTWTAGAGITGPQTIKAIYIYAQKDPGPTIGPILWIKKIAPTVTLSAEAEEFSRQLEFNGGDIAALD